MRTIQNTTIKSGFRKPNTQWLGRWYVIKTFDNEVKYGVDEILEILDEVANAELTE